jgi:hypothetical protein
MLRPHYWNSRFHKDLFEEDKKVFLSLPSVRFDESKTVAVRTDKLRQVHFE